MYLDSNVFIYASLVPDEKGAKARSILQKVARGTEAVTSSLTLDEVMWVCVRHGARGKLRAIIEGIYGIKNLHIVPVSSVAPMQALELVEQKVLDPRDAVHVAVMREHGIKEIISDDADFDKVPGLKRTAI